MKPTNVLARVLRAMTGLGLLNLNTHRSHRDALSDEWSEREKTVQKLVPEGHSVIEFGAGKAILREYFLNRNFYVATDIVIRPQIDAVIDLDNPPLDLVDFDYGIALGVLEYLSDLDKALTFIGNKCQNLIFSYCENKPGIRNQIRRRLNGWRNHRSMQDLVHTLSDNHYDLVHIELLEKTRHFNQFLFMVTRTSS